MHVSDLAIPLPIVGRDTTAVAAAKIIAHGERVSLVVADAAGRPVAVVSAVDLLRILIPRYLLGDASLAAMFDERGADEVWAETGDRTIGELLDDDESRVLTLLRVDGDATVLEAAAQFAQERAVVAVVDGMPGAEPRFVMLPALLEAILRLREPSSDRDARA